MWAEGGWVGLVVKGSPIWGFRGGADCCSSVRNAESLAKSPQKVALKTGAQNWRSKLALKKCAQNMVLKKLCSLNGAEKLALTEALEHGVKKVNKKRRKKLLQE